MPSGIPVATVALDGAKNAGILAAEIIGAYDELIAQNLGRFKSSLKEKVEETVLAIETKGWKSLLNNE